MPKRLHVAVLHFTEHRDVPWRDATHTHSQAVYGFSIKLTRRWGSKKKKNRKKNNNKSERKITVMPLDVSFAVRSHDLMLDARKLAIYSTHSISAFTRMQQLMNRTHILSALNLALLPAIVVPRSSTLIWCCASSAFVCACVSKHLHKINETRLREGCLWIRRRRRPTTTSPRWKKKKSRFSVYIHIALEATWRNFLFPSVFT